MGKTMSAHEYKRKKAAKKKDGIYIEDSGIHAFVATPAYNGKVDTDYAIALAESCQMATMHGIRVTAVVISNSCFIDLCRNTLVAMFLKTDCTHLFFIDSDLRWEPRAMVGLLQSGRPVCAGAYRKREEPESYPIAWMEEEDGGIRLEDGGWLKCSRVATGFLCIERRVIEEMAASSRMITQASPDFPHVPRLFYTDLLEDGRFKGEDFAWCDDYVAKYKQPIWLWPDFDMVHGGYPCNMHKFMNALAEKIAEEDRKLLPPMEPIKLEVAND
jgi:hypothetical protein